MKKPAILYKLKYLTAAECPDTVGFGLALSRVVYERPVKR